MHTDVLTAEAPAMRAWPEGGSTRVPAWIYTDPATYEKEMELFFAGPTWSYVGLACEVPNPGSFKRSWIGPKQVLVVRDEDGGINVVENRCAHRNGAICWKPHGEVKELTCPYHQWSYNLQGDLRGVPLKRGMHGVGGMPPDFDNKAHGLRKLRVTVRGGLVWASFSDDVADFETYCGPEVIRMYDRTYDGRALRLLGHTRQSIPCNWKKYFENNRDPYHGTLLHTFFVVFGLYRADNYHMLTPEGGGRNIALYSQPKSEISAADAAELPRFRDDLKVNDAGTVRPRKEFADGGASALQVFPTAHLQQHGNSLAIRNFIPRGPQKMEVSWTFFGFEDDDAEMQLLRLKQANLLGPAGFVSMDDSELLKQLQSVVAGYPDTVEFVEMGGRDAEPTTGMATEAGIRAFYAFYRHAMGL